MNFFQVFKDHDATVKAWLSRKRAASKWEKLGGQKGSNPGGVYSYGGEKHYVKFPPSKGQIWAEAAADKMYELMGVATMNHTPTEIEGKWASVSKWKEVKELGYEGWSKLTPKQVQQAADAFVASALTKNWDVVGLTYDNMGTTKKGDLAIMDTGGSFKYRAMGGDKKYDADPTAELKAMQDPEKTSGRVYGPLMKKHPEAFKAAAVKLAAIPNAAIREAAATMKDTSLGSIAIRRKQAILRYFGVGEQK